MAEDFSGSSVAVEDLPDFSAASIEVPESPEEALSAKRARLGLEQEAARLEIGPITEALASDQPLVPPPSPSEASMFAAPIGFPRMVPVSLSPKSGEQVREFTPTEQGVREFIKTLIEMPSEMTRPTMLPVAAVSAVPIPGVGPAMRYVIPRAAGVYFGAQAGGAGAGELVAGIEQGEPKLIGRGGATMTLGGLALPEVIRALPRSAAAATETPTLTIPPNIVPLQEIQPLQPFLPARVQPGARAGFPPIESRQAPVVPGTPAEPRETVIEAIRKADARTLNQIKALFPEAKLSNEQARVFRNIAFPPVPEPVRPQATVAEVLGKPPEPPPESGGATVPKPAPEPTGGPENAVPISSAETQVRGLSSQPVVNEGDLSTQESVAGVPQREQGAGAPAGVRAISEQTQAPEVPVTDPVGNAPEFYSLPRLRALERSADPRVAAAKKFYGAKTIPDLARLAKARFDEMAARAKPAEEPKPTALTPEEQAAAQRQLEEEVPAARAEEAPAPEPPKPPEPAKEPWQMTKHEAFGLRERLEQEHDTLLETSQEAASQFAERNPIIQGVWPDAHYRVVVDALEEGKPVPAEVLADYPDLNPAKEAAPTTPAPVAEAKAQAEVPRVWYESLGEPTKQRIFALMHEVQGRIDAAAERERALRPPQGSIAAGAAGFDEFIKSESQAEFLRKIRNGSTPENAESSAKEWAREAVAIHNRKRPKDVNWQRWEGTADSYIDRLRHEFEDAGKPEPPTAPKPAPETPAVPPPPETPKAAAGLPEPPTPPNTTRYGMVAPGMDLILGDMAGTSVSPTAEPFWNTERTFSSSIKDAASWIRDMWRGFAMKQAPRITDSNRAAGESGVRYAASHLVARAKGLEFAENVLRDTKVDPKKFGVALVEDNLRGIKDNWQKEAAAETAKGSPTLAAAAQDRADAVRTLIGAERSPFKTEAEYQTFLNEPAVKTAIARHIQLWREQKDPLYRKANDLDPETPLASRGLQTGARINLKALQPDEKGVARVGGTPTKLRQLATKLRRDPFAQRARGSAQAYEGDYNEIMAHGFGVEYPIAAQHEFIKALIDAGDAIVTDREFPEGLTIKGEKPVANILRLNPWRGKFLQVRRSLSDEYRAISNLDEAWKIPILSPLNDFMTKMSIQGFAEGTTHSSNLMTEILTGLGPTNNPLVNALIKSVGRADLLYSVPRVIIKAFSNSKPEMLRLAEKGMAKEPYSGKYIASVLNATDRGVRLVSSELYDGMAAKGWVENTETSKREFINQVGNYNKRLQPKLIRRLRDTGVQPFATAAQTFNVMGIRRLVGAPGVKATSKWAALALRADIAGGFVGFIALTAMLNKLISGSVTGPNGTPLGAVGWVGDDGKVHSFNVGRLFGYERGTRITGIGPYLEARRQGLTHEQAVEAAQRALTTTGLSYVAGPGPRALYTGITGYRMTQPTVREAPVVPPTESLNPFKTQLAKNIQTALIESNPALSSIRDLHEGKEWSDVAERQFSRYTPRAGRTEQFMDVLPRIVTRRQAIEYADDVVREARKLPMGDRIDYIYKRFEKDGLEAQYHKDVMTEIKRKGVLKFE